MGPRGRWLAQPARCHDLGNHQIKQNYHANSDRLIVLDRVTWAPSKFAFRNPRPAAVKNSQTVCGGGAPGPAEKLSRPPKQPPGRSDHLGSVPRLEPTDRRVINGVGKRNLAQRLTCCHTLQGLRALGAWSASASGQIVCLRPWRERGL